jgi:ribosomal protein S18 acetylase RimI-like enzyme
MIDVRQAVPGDEPEVRRLAELARSMIVAAKGGPQLVASLDTVDDVVGALEHVLLGMIGGQVVGYGLVRADGRVGTLPELFVEPPARQVGIGVALLRAAQDRLVAAGCSTVDSLALPGDRATKNFFEAHGMVTRLLVTHRSLAVADGTD